MDPADTTLPTAAEDVMEIANTTHSMSAEQESMEILTEQGDMESSTEQGDMETSTEKGDTEISEQNEDMETSTEQEDAERESIEQPKECPNCQEELDENFTMVRVLGCHCTFCTDCFKLRLDRFRLHACPLCGEMMGTVQLGNWHEEKGFMSVEESRAAKIEQEEEEEEVEEEESPRRKYIYKRFRKGHGPFSDDDEGNWFDGEGRWVDHDDNLLDDDGQPIEIPDSEDEDDSAGPGGMFVDKKGNIVDGGGNVLIKRKDIHNPDLSDYHNPSLGMASIQASLWPKMKSFKY